MRKKEKGEREIKAPTDEVSYFIKRKRERERETERDKETILRQIPTEFKTWKTFKLAPAN